MKITHELTLKLTKVSLLLGKEDLAPKDKIVMSLQELSGLDITNFKAQTKDLINKHLIETNSILKKYPIITFDDYALISDKHQAKLMKSIRRICMHLLINEACG